MDGPGGMPLVSLAGVGKGYEDAGCRQEVFRGLDLTVARGERLALLGRSGSGKSTLLNLIGGIDLPDAGEVHVDGARLDRLGERDRTLFRRRRIGYVFQFFNLIPTLSVLDNLLLPLELNGTAGPAEKERAMALLERLGLADRAARLSDRLAGGEQQRVAVARALIHRPALLLADEPTGNLDAETGARVLELLDDLGRETGMTMVLVTHSSEVAAVADRVLRLRDGGLEPVRTARGEPGSAA